MGGAQVECLQAAAAGIAVGKGAADRFHHIFIFAEGFADHERFCVFQRLADFLAARNLTDAGVAAVILQNQNIAGKVRGMRAAEV